VVWTEYFRWEWLFFDGAILAFCVWQLISLRRLKRLREAKAAREEADEQKR
jgi:hypothetical protein